MTQVLREIEAALAEAEREAAHINKKIEDLREAAKRLRPYYEPSGGLAYGGTSNVSFDAGARAEGKKDLAGMTIEDAAAVILREGENQGMPSDEIARAAIARGYRSTSSRNPENDPKKIMTSFRVTMKRLTQKFENEGRLFKLKEQ